MSRGDNSLSISYWEEQQWGRDQEPCMGPFQRDMIKKLFGFLKMLFCVLKPQNIVIFVVHFVDLMHSVSLQGGELW